MKVIIGTKIGMTQIIGEDGLVTPVTILQAGPATVTQVKTAESDGYNAVQLGYGQGKNLSKSVSGHVKKAGENITPKVLREFRLENAAEAKRLGLCVEMEVWQIIEDAQGNIDNPQHIEKFMDYMYAGAETGSMLSCKTYYHGSAPGGCITNGWKSKNPRYRELYDTCYLFAKEKLEVK